MKPFNYELEAYLKKRGLKFYMRTDGIWLSHKGKAYRLTEYRKGVAVEAPMLNDKIQEFESIESFVVWFEKL